MSIEQQIAEIQDKMALARLMHDYGRIADGFDWDGWAETFTDDTVFEFVGGFGTMKGKEVVKTTCKGAMDHVYDVMQHSFMNLEFDTDGDTATGNGYLIFTGIMDADEPTRYYQSGGRYKWQFRRTAAGWRIAHTILEFIWNNGGDDDSVFQEQNAEAVG